MKDCGYIVRPSRKHHRNGNTFEIGDDPDDEHEPATAVSEIPHPAGDHRRRVEGPRDHFPALPHDVEARAVRVPVCRFGGTR